MSWRFFENKFAFSDLPLNQNSKNQIEIKQYKKKVA